MNRSFEQTILVVDDEPDIIDLLQEHLEEEGYRTLAAATGTEAIMIARKDRPDLILLDVMMPGMSGFEVCNMLQDSPLTSSIPVIFLTAVTETPRKVMGLRMGAEDYITKPFDLRELSARVEVALRRSPGLNVTSVGDEVAEEVAQDRVSSSIPADS